METIDGVILVNGEDYQQLVGELRMEEKLATSLHTGMLDNETWLKLATSECIKDQYHLRQIASAYKLLLRGCVNCGQWTVGFCDGFEQFVRTKANGYTISVKGICRASARQPDQGWQEDQRTPLCSDCDNSYTWPWPGPTPFYDYKGRSNYKKCHFCMGQDWCMPRTWHDERGPGWCRQNGVPKRILTIEDIIRELNSQQRQQVQSLMREYKATARAKGAKGNAADSESSDSDWELVHSELPVLAPGGELEETMPLLTCGSPLVKKCPCDPPCEEHQLWWKFGKKRRNDRRYERQRVFEQVPCESDDRPLDGTEEDFQDFLKGITRYTAKDLEEMNKNRTAQVKVTKLDEWFLQRFREKCSVDDSKVEHSKRGCGSKGRSFIGQSMEPYMLDPSTRVLFLGNESHKLHGNGAANVVNNKKEPRQPLVLEFVINQTILEGLSTDERTERIMALMTADKTPDLLDEVLIRDGKSDWWDTYHLVAEGDPSGRKPMPTMEVLMDQIIQRSYIDTMEEMRMTTYGIKFQGEDKVMVNPKVAYKVFNALWANGRQSTYEPADWNQVRMIQNFSKQPGQESTPGERMIQEAREAHQLWIENELIIGPEGSHRREVELHVCKSFVVKTDRRVSGLALIPDSSPYYGTEHYQVWHFMDGRISMIKARLGINRMMLMTEWEENRTQYDVKMWNYSAQVADTDELATIKKTLLQLKCKWWKEWVAPTRRCKGLRPDGEIPDYVVTDDDGCPPCHQFMTTGGCTNKGCMRSHRCPILTDTGKLCGKMHAVRDCEWLADPKPIPASAAANERRSRSPLRASSSGMVDSECASATRRVIQPEQTHGMYQPTEDEDFQMMEELDHAQRAIPWPEQTIQKQLTFEELTKVNMLLDTMGIGEMRAEVEDEDWRDGLWEVSVQGIRMAKPSVAELSEMLKSRSMTIPTLKPDCPEERDHGLMVRNDHDTPLPLLFMFMLAQQVRRRPSSMDPLPRKLRIKDGHFVNEQDQQIILLATEAGCVKYSEVDAAAWGAGGGRFSERGPSYLDWGFISDKTWTCQGFLVTRIGMPAIQVADTKVWVSMIQRVDAWKYEGVIYDTPLTTSWKAGWKTQDWQSKWDNPPYQFSQGEIFKAKKFKVVFYEDVQYDLNQVNERTNFKEEAKKGPTNTKWSFKCEVCEQPVVRGDNELATCKYCGHTRAQPVSWSNKHLLQMSRTSQLQVIKNHVAALMEDERTARRMKEDTMLRDSMMEAKEIQRRTEGTPTLRAIRKGILTMDQWANKSSEQVAVMILDRLLEILRKEGGPQTMSILNVWPVTMIGPRSLMDTVGVWDIFEIQDTDGLAKVLLNNPAKWVLLNNDTAPTRLQEVEVKTVMGPTQIAMELSWRSYHSRREHVVWLFKLVSQTRMEGASFENTRVNRRATATRRLSKESIVPCGVKETEYTGVEEQGVTIATSLTAAEKAEIYDATGEVLQQSDEAWKQCMAKTPRAVRQMAHWTITELLTKLARFAATKAARTPLEGGVSIEERWLSGLHVNWLDALKDAPLHEDEYAQIAGLMDGNSTTLLEEIVIKKMHNIWVRGAGRMYRVHKAGEKKKFSAEERQAAEENAAEYVSRVDDNSEITVRCTILKALGAQKLQYLQSTGTSERNLQETGKLHVTSD